MTYAEYLRHYGMREASRLRAGPAVTGWCRQASTRRTWAPRPQRTPEGADWIAQAQLRRLGIDVRL
jgi:hypothetical protein